MPDGMNDNIINFLFSVRPPPAEDKKKIRKFFSLKGHLTMERADTLNNTEWFDKCVEKGYLPAMKYHRAGIGNTFDMSNFDKWIIDRHHN
jgi:hypothetical protein